MRTEQLSCGGFVFIDEAAEQFVFADVPCRGADGRRDAFVGRLKRE
jgi:hypothetical protein